MHEIRYETLFSDDSTKQIAIARMLRERLGWQKWNFAKQ